jgi:hypothetical protein
MKLLLAVLCLSLLPQPVGNADAGDNVMRVRYLQAPMVDQSHLPGSLTCTRWCFQPGGMMPFTVVIRKTFLLDNGYERVIDEIE